MALIKMKNIPFRMQQKAWQNIMHARSVLIAIEGLDKYSNHNAFNLTQDEMNRMINLMAMLRASGKHLAEEIMSKVDNLPPPPDDNSTSSPINPDKGSA